MADTNEVFSLRKKGNLKKALRKGRQCYEESPNDIWAMRALGWTLYDLMKNALDKSNISDARAYLDEFDAMNMPVEDDELIHDKMDGLRRQIESPAVRKAEEASRAGNYAKAVGLFRKARSEVSVDDDFKKQNGWVLRNRIHELVEDEQPPIGVLHRLFLEFAELDPPSDEKLYKAILFDAEKVADQWKEYNGFLHWWNVDLFRGEHFQPFQREDQTYPSLACRAARAGAKRALTDDDDDAAEWLLPVLKDILERGNDDELWIRYDIGRLANLVGDRETAQKHLRQVVRAKYTESWAWGYFADTFDDLEDRKAALCAALDGAPKDSFGLSIREELASLLISEEEFAQAKREVLNIIEIREGEGYDLPNRVAKWRGEGWFEDTDAADSNQAYYGSHADHARDLVLQDISWADGIVTGHQESRDGRPARTFLGIKDSSGRLRDAFARDKNHDILGNLSAGTPISVRADLEGPSVYDIRERDGAAWDLLSKETAVVDHINKDSNVTHIVISDKRHGLAYHDSVPGSESFERGDYVKVRSLGKKKDRPERIVDVEETEEVPPKTVNRFFEGYFSFPSDGRTHFGFVQDYYVPEELIEAYDLSNRQKIQGRAILVQPDEDKWRVVEIGDSEIDSSNQ